MIGEIIPSFYDIQGKSIDAPSTKRRKKLFCSTFPFGRYLSKPLSIQCTSIKDVRKFLSTCKYVSDEKQFGREDYWLPPDEFEEIKQGDCEDYALWTWRQFMNMGYESRLVIGRAGKYGEGHAWITYEKEGKHYLVEPMAWHIGTNLPRLSVARYEPRGSIEWDGKRLRYFIHEKPVFNLPISEYVLLPIEWLTFWTRFWFLVLIRLVKAIAGRIFGKLVITTDSEPLGRKNT